MQIKKIIHKKLSYDDFCEICENKDIINKLHINKSTIDLFKKWNIKFSNEATVNLIMGFFDEELNYVILDKNNNVLFDDNICKTIDLFIKLNTLNSRQFSKTYNLSIFLLGYDGEYVL
jgi:hypothetical protein